jgi:hypothetical protein
MCNLGLSRFYRIFLCKLCAKMGIVQLQGYMELARLSVEREVVAAVNDSETLRLGIFRTPKLKSSGSSTAMPFVLFPQIDINCCSSNIFICCSTSLIEGR